MKNNRITINLLLIIIFFIGCRNNKTTDTLSRQKVKFDFNWKFTKGDFPDASQIDFDDSKWEQIDIPHDWAILDTFSKENPAGSSGGFASGGIGWYRKIFTLDERDKNSKISIEFGGVYENSEVWINGHYLGKRPFGYISFNYNLSPYLDFNGQNVLAVRVDNSKQPSARWYTGCGIYRHVWLIITSKLHVARHGVYASTPFVTADSALLKVRTTIENDFDELKQINLDCELYSSKNELVARVQTSAGISGREKLELVQKMTILKPELW
jgi:beta-galactosidase